MNQLIAMNSLLSFVMVTNFMNPVDVGNKILEVASHIILEGIKEFLKWSFISSF